MGFLGRKKKQFDFKEKRRIVHFNGAGSSQAFENQLF